VMTGDQVIQAVQQGIANSSAQSSLAGLLGPAPTFRSGATEPAGPPQPKRDTVRIYGLDEGTREIKAEPRQ